MSNLPIGLFVGIYFGWEMCTHTGESWHRSNTDPEPCESKWLAKGNPYKMPHTSDSNYCEGVTLSLWVCPCVPSHIPFSNNQFTCFTTFCICGNVFFFAKSKGQGLVIEHWSNGWDSALSLPWPNLSLWPGTRRLRPSEINFTIQDKRKDTDKYFSYFSFFPLEQGEKSFKNIYGVFTNVI